MRKAANYFTDRTVLRRYLHLEDPEAKIPTANSATNGSIPGMMRFLCGESITDLQAMADAFSEWEKSNTEGVSAN